ncbi:MAG: hypothetical protein HWN66_16285 [Candidatus Helarchaeota archaeon]|nr:hypothetical protein [Candidatus Helarchaeota archaeon]
MVKVKMRKFLQLLPPEYAKVYEDGLIHNWNIEEAWKDVSIKTPLNVVDMTLRDGEQQTGIYFTPEQKLELFKEMEDIGFNGMEIGFPAVSEDEKKACKLIFDEHPVGLNFVMSRALKSDVDAAIDVGAPALDLFTSSSDFHIKHKLKMDRETNKENFLEICDYVRDHDLRVVFGREDCSRADIPYMCDLIISAKERLKHCFATFGLADTTGSMTPRTVQWWIKRVEEEFIKQGHPDIKPLGIHCHNDYGLATANVLSSIEVGCTGLNGTLTGIGERAGNAPLEEIITILMGLLGVKLRINLEKMYEVAKKVSQYAGVPIPINKPVIGANAFKHESGIHAAGVLAHPYTYEAIPHAWFGRKSVFRYGKFSGTDVVLKDALQPLGINPTKEQLRAIVLEVKREQIRRGKEKYEQFVQDYNEVMESMGMKIEEVEAIARKVMGK